MISTLVSVLLLVPGAVASDAYELSTMIEWDIAELDMLVQGEYLPEIGVAIQRGITVWQEAIAADEWSGDAIELCVYLVATDAAPPAGFGMDDVEIYVIPQGGVAVSISLWSFDDQVCHANAPYGHEVEPLFGPDSMYRVVAHESGHCLGLGHVFAHGVEYAPMFDIMGGGRGPACPSDLDVQVMELAFGGLCGRESGGTVTMASGDYFQMDC